VLTSTNALWLASARVYVFSVLWGLLVAFLAFCSSYSRPRLFQLAAPRLPTDLGVGVFP
jgi:hypothetical protein